MQCDWIAWQTAPHWKWSVSVIFRVARIVGTCTRPGSTITMRLRGLGCVCAGPGGLVYKIYILVYKMFKKQHLTWFIQTNFAGELTCKFITVRLRWFHLAAKTTCGGERWHLRFSSLLHRQIHRLHENWSAISDIGAHNFLARMAHR